MIVSWISHDNRKQRRVSKARARRAGIDLAIHRVSSAAVSGHIAALTTYLISPTGARLEELAAIEAAKNHVVRYIGSDKAIEDVESADIATARDIAGAERVVQVLTRNLLSTDVADIQFEMAIVAGMAPAGEDPIEHIVLSWPEGEHPTPEQVEDVLDIVLTVAGMSRHQAFAVLHGDTGNDHLHVALNRIDPVSGERVQIGRNIERSIETLHQALAIVEHRQDWVAQEKALYRADATGCYERETGIKVRDANLLPCASSADQRQIRAWRAEQKLERKISPAASDFERRTGIESLQRRVIETAAPVFRSATDWRAVHRGLAREGMRYKLLTSGAVIVCGHREIAASTAWGGASAAKMIERLGAFEEPANEDIVAPFEDRLIPKLHEAAEKRRLQQALRQERAGLDQSLDHARNVIGDRYRRIVAADPLADTEALNDIRRRASAELASLRDAIERLEARRRKVLKRKRRARDGGEPVDVEEQTDEAAAMLIGEIAVNAPTDPPQTQIEEDYDIVETGYHRAHYRASRLAFVEHRDRIDLHALDDDALRHALRLAKAKWGSVAAIADGPFIDRLARLAVEEGVSLTNPELQGRIARLTATVKLQRQLDRIKQQLAVPSVEQSMLKAPQPSLPSRLQADYAPAFSAWLERRADPAAAAGRIEAEAYAIFVQPELRRQLAELESQQFEFAIDLKRSALRYATRLRKLHDKHQKGLDQAPIDDLGKIPSLSDLSPRIEELERQGLVSFAPSPEPVRSTDSLDQRVAPAIDRDAQDLERRYLDWTARQRAGQIAQIDRERAAALRARVGDPASPPRHIARLLLREAARHRSSRSPSASETDRRDRQEMAALALDPMFAQLVGRVRLQDPEVVQALRRVDAGGDVLGRVPLVRGRLDFAYVSETGHDAGARPPLEWIEADLRRIDFTQVRLTRQDGMVGLYDADLLAATHYNHVGLLSPEVQAQLEVEWRLQRERDVAILAKVQAGSVALSARLDLDDWFYAKIDVPRGVTEAERRHIATMAHDAEVFISLLETQRGEQTAEAPLDALPLMAAYRRAQKEKADPVVVGLLANRLRDASAGTKDRRSHVEASSEGRGEPTHQASGYRGRDRGGPNRPKPHDRDWQR